MTKTVEVAGAIIRCKNCGREMYLRQGIVGAKCPACQTTYFVEIGHKYHSVKGAAENFSVTVTDDGN